MDFPAPETFPLDEKPTNIASFNFDLFVIDVHAQPMRWLKEWRLIVSTGLGTSYIWLPKLVGFLGDIDTVCSIANRHDNCGSGPIANWFITPPDWFLVITVAGGTIVAILSERKRSREFINDKIKPHIDQISKINKRFGEIDESFRQGLADLAENREVSRAYIASKRIYNIDKALSLIPEKSYAELNGTVIRRPFEGSHDSKLDQTLEILSGVSNARARESFSEIRNMMMADAKYLDIPQAESEMWDSKDYRRERLIRQGFLDNYRDLIICHRESIISAQPTGVAILKFDNFGQVRS